MSLDDSAGVCDRIIWLLLTGGSSQYLGEKVSQLEHALQSAALADAAGAPDALVIAALLHDFGHLLPADVDHAADSGIDLRHEDLGHAWLAEHFSPSVTEPVRLHVSAKRYLCATDPAYRASLSPASAASLALQGGPMRAEECEAFIRTPWAQSAVALRHWDDAAKVPGLAVPGLSEYRGRIEHLLKW